MSDEEKDREALRVVKNEYSRERYAALYARGVCSRCKAERMPDSTMCAKHLAAERERQRANHAARRAGKLDGRTLAPHHCSTCGLRGHNAKGCPTNIPQRPVVACNCDTKRSALDPEVKVAPCAYHRGYQRMRQRKQRHIAFTIAVIADTVGVSVAAVVENLREAA